MNDAPERSEAAALLEAAQAAHQADDLDAAEPLYRRILEREPGHAVAAHLLALVRRQRGDLEEALALLLRSLSRNPRSALAHQNLGLVLSDLGRHEEALRHLQLCLRFNPGSPDALFPCAAALQALDRREEALARWDELLALAPDHAAALLNRGMVRQDLQQPEGAAADFARALALDPGQAQVLLGRAIALVRERRPVEALALLDLIVATRADFADAHAERGVLFQSLARSADALAAFDRALAADPRNLPALVGRASVLVSLGRPTEALATSDLALEVEPRCVEALLNRGTSLLELGRPGEALPSLDLALLLDSACLPALVSRAAALLALKRPDEAMAASQRILDRDPDSVEAMLNFATALMEKRQVERALALFERAVELRPDWMVPWMNRGSALHSLGRHREAMADYDRALALAPEQSRAHSSRVGILDFLAEADFAEHQAERRRYCEAHARRFEAVPPAEPLDRDPERRLVLGYVSADFKNHATASCFLPVMQRHDRGRFQVNCYSNVMVEDDWTRMCMEASDLWCRSAGLTDEDLAARIRADRVDVLVDLSGHTSGNRLLVFARRPAPVQVSGWGHGGGTGLPMIDALFADPVAIPAEVRPLFPETVWDLPAHIPFQAPAFAPEVAPPPVRANGFVTFGSLNRYTKVTPEVEAVWARILLALPTARLLLKDALFGEPLRRQEVLDGFAGRGVDPGRITLMGASSRAEHLTAYGQVDIALDPWPLNGGITTWESLWMGVPVLALLGRAIGSRAAGAILHAVGMADWVAADGDDYVRVACAKAADLGALERFRRDCRAHLLATPAGNPDRYTRAVEDAYRTLWRRYLARSGR